MSKNNDTNLTVTIEFKGPVTNADKGDIAGKLIDVVEEALEEFPDSKPDTITVEESGS